MRIRIFLGLFLVAWCACCDDYDSTGSGAWSDAIWNATPGPAAPAGPNLGHNGGLLGTDSVEIKLGHDVTFNPDVHFGGNDLAINGGQTLTLQGGSVTQTTSNSSWLVGQGNVGTIDIQDGTLNVGSSDQLMLGIDAGNGSLFLGDNVGLADTAVLAMGSRQLIVGQNSIGALTINSDGLLTAAGSIHFAQDTGSTAAFTMNGGRISQTSGDFYFGRRGDATGTLNDDARIDHTTGNWFWIAENAGTSSLTLNDDSIIDTNADRVMIGRRNGSDGTLTLNDNAQFISNQTVQVGSLGGSTGLIDLVGGTLSLNNLNIGSNTDGTNGHAVGTVLMKPGSTATVSNSLWVGRQGDGTLTITGGSLAATNGLAVALETGSVGELNVSGAGELTVGIVGSTTKTLSVGRKGEGALNQTGGTVIITNQLLIGQDLGGEGTVSLSGGTLDTGGTLSLGHNVGTTGDLTISGTADVNVGDATTRRNMLVGRNALGTVTQTGGSLIVSNELQIGVNIGSIGGYNISGGTLETQRNLHIAQNIDSLGGMTISGTAVVDVGSTSDRRAMLVGRQGDGRILQTGGDVTVSGELRVGGSDGSDGGYHISGGTLAVQRNVHVAQDVGSTGAILVSGTADVDVGSVADRRNLLVGRNANGSVTQTGGSVTVSNELRIGESGTSEGTYDISGGTLTTQRNLILGQLDGATGEMLISGTADMNVGSLVDPRNMMVGRSGMGTVTQTGGQVFVSDQLQVGFNTDADGTYDISGGSLEVDAQVSVGFATDSSGVLRVSGLADVDFDQHFRVGRSTTARVEQSGGNLDVALTAYVGSWIDGDGTYDLSGGTATFQGNLELARHATSTGTLLVNDGMIDAKSRLVVGANGAGVVTQTGGVVAVGTDLRVGYAGTGSGTYNLNGGTLRFNGTSALLGPNGTFNFGGGTMELQSARDFSSPMTMTGIGGAGTIDTNGFDSEHSGVLTGGGTLNKAGVGTLTVSGNNAGLTGGYRVEEGNIVIANPGALGDPSRVHIAGGSSFDLPNAAFTGGTTFNFAGTDLTVSGAGAFNVGDGGGGTFEWNHRTSLAPGNSPGELVINAATVNWDSSFPVVGSGGDYNWQLFDATGDVGDDWDMVTINGDLNVWASGNIVVEGLDALPNSAGIPTGLDLAMRGNTTGPLEILSAQSISGIGNISVDLGNLAPYVTYVLEGNPSIHNIGHAGLFITFTSTVPEPGTWALLGILLVAGVFYTRRSTPASK